MSRTNGSPTRSRGSTASTAMSRRSPGASPRRAAGPISPSAPTGWPTPAHWAARDPRGRGAAVRRAPRQPDPALRRPAHDRADAPDRRATPALLPVTIGAGGRGAGRGAADRPSRRLPLHRRSDARARPTSGCCSPRPRSGSPASCARAGGGAGRSATMRRCRARRGRRGRLAGPRGRRGWRRARRLSRAARSCSTARSTALDSRSTRDAVGAARARGSTTQLARQLAGAAATLDAAARDPDADAARCARSRGALLDGRRAAYRAAPLRAAVEALDARRAQARCARLGVTIGTLDLFAPRAAQARRRALAARC